MTAAPERGDRLTVAVLPGGDRGAALLQVMTAWTAGGLLIPSLWVDPARAQLAPDRAPVVPAWHLGSWGSSEEDLFEVLGRHQRDLVRVVAVQLLAAAGEVDAGQLSLADRILDWVRDSVPSLTRVETEGYAGTEVRSLNVVVGVTGLGAVPDTATRGGWDVNVVTSPEDRRDPGRANVFVRHPGNLVPVAAATVAAVAGLYAAVGEGPFDRLSPDASPTLGKVTVVRATVRALLGERIVEAVAREAAMQALDTGGPAVTEGDRYAVTGHPDGLVERALAWTEEADGGALKLCHLPPPGPRPKVRVPLTAAFLAFLRFAGQALVSVPLTVYGWLVRRAENTATRALSGPHSGIEVTLRPSVSVCLGEEAAAGDERARADAASAIAKNEALPVAGPTAGLWTSLRALLHGLLDGVGLPAGFEPPKDGLRTLVLPGPASLGPRPDDTFRLAAEVAALLGPDTAAGPEVGALDVLGYDVCLGEVAAASDAQATRLGQIDGELAQLAQEHADLAAPGGPEETALRRRGAELEAQRAAVVRTGELVQAELTRLAAWHAMRAESFLWRCRRRVVRQVGTARAEEAALRRLIAAPATLDVGEPARLHRRFVRRALVWAAVVVVSGWALVAGGTRVGWLVGAVLAAGVWLGLVLRAYYQGVLAFLERFRIALELRRGNVSRLIHLTRERRRLEVADRRLGLWGTVHGWSLHRPWSADLPPLAELRTVMDPALMPESMRLAEPTLDDEHERRQAVAIGVASLARAGWRSRTFADLLAAHEHLRDDSGAEEALGRLDQDESAGTGPLGRFAAALDAGQPQRDVLAEVLSRAQAELREQNLGQDQLSVTPDRVDPHEPTELPADRFFGQLIVAASPFAKELWSAGALTDGAHARPATMLWVQPGMASRAPAGATVRTLQDPGRAGGAMVDVAVRVDLTGPVEISSLRLFCRSEVTPVPAQSDAGDFL